MNHPQRELRAHAAIADACPAAVLHNQCRRVQCVRACLASRTARCGPVMGVRGAAMRLCLNE